MIETLKKNPKTIVLTEGTDARILEASSRLLASNFLKPILVGNPDEVYNAAEEAGFNIRGAQIMDPATFEDMDKMIDCFLELRKSKGVTYEQAKEMLSHANYFGTMLVKMGYADALLGGATYSTADTVRPALQLIKTKPGNHIVSSCFILVRPSASGENEVLAMGDCAINIKPSEDDLVEIAEETIKCARLFGVNPEVAFLSYSTDGSEVNLNDAFVRASLGGAALGGFGSSGLSSMSAKNWLESLSSSSGSMFSGALSSAALKSNKLELPKDSVNYGKDFFLWVKTRLIVYGGTRPDAHLQVRGEPFPLNPDGTFSFEEDLPDSTKIIPVFATDKDGDFPTTIVPIVVKRTE